MFQWVSAPVRGSQPVAWIGERRRWLSGPGRSCSIKPARGMGGSSGRFFQPLLFPFPDRAEKLFLRPVADSVIRADIGRIGLSPRGLPRW